MSNNLTNVILPGVQGELEKYCNRPLEPTHIREVRLANERGYVVFTKTPVWSINFILNTRTNQQLPLVPPLDPALPTFVVDPTMRNYDEVGTGPIIGLPYEYQVGNTAWGYGGWGYGGLVSPMDLPLSVEEIPYVCDYVAGWKGAEEPGLALAILQIAARTTERMYDDTMSIKGGTLSAAEDSDPQLKYWQQEELEEWDRLRRRVVI